MKRPFAAYQGAEPYVFVCYAHDDSEKVYPEIQRLHEGGVRIWYDEGISPGMRWSDELARALSKASLVLFFCTPQSVKSKHCQDEMNFALDEDRPLLVIQDGPVDLPPGLRLRLGAHQSILKHDLSAEQFADKLTSAIRRRVSTTPQSEPAVRKTAPPATASRDKRLSVAVLPFRCSSSDPAIGTFVEGLAGEIVNELAGSSMETLRQYRMIAELKVASARSTLRYAGTTEDLASIGRSLGVVYVVEGSVRSAGPQTRVAVQLIRAEDDEQVWSHTYDESAEDPLRTQSDIARHAAARITSCMGDDHWYRNIIRPRFSNVGAYNYFVKGRRSYRDGLAGSSVDWIQVAANLEKALDLDPDFFFVYEFLISAYLQLTEDSTEPLLTVRPIGELLTRMEALLGPDPDLYSLYYDRAYFFALKSRYHLLRLEYASADQEVRQALSGGPNAVRALFSQGVLFLHRERPNEAIASLRRAFAAGGGGRLPFVWMLLVQTLRACGQSTAALSVLESAVEREPGDLGVDPLPCDDIGTAKRLTEQAITYVGFGKADRAAALVDQTWELCGLDHPDLFPAALAATGRGDRARALLAELEAAGAARRVNPMTMIEGYVAAGDLDAAFRWINRAVDARLEPVVRWMHLVTVSVAGVWPITLTSDPRWRQTYAKLPTVEDI